MYQEMEGYLRGLCADLIHGCRKQAFDGTTLYTPDGVANYDALWLRDFSYMTEYAGFAIPEEDIAACIRYAIRCRRADGWMPDRAAADGTGIYAAGEAGFPIGEANLDNTPFLVFNVYSLYKRMDADTFLPLFREWEPYLTKGLSLIPLDGKGLVSNPPDSPHSPYGFTDTICKTGSLYMESLLFWRACRMMETMCGALKAGNAGRYASCASAIEKAAGILFDPDAGAYFAASGDCRQYDIWGMAYMLYIGFPVDEETREAVLGFLCEHYNQYMYRGQVRHLLQGQYWQKLLIGVEPETYQNGAYWATATGWVLWCLAQKDEALARRTIEEAVSYLKEEGSYECINREYQKLPSFVVSAVNIYGGLVRAASEFPRFLKAPDISNGGGIV